MDAIASQGLTNILLIGIFVALCFMLDRMPRQS